LIVISIFTPILYFLIKKLGGWFLTFIAILYIGNINGPIPSINSTTILFFGIGTYYAINRKNIILEFRKIEKPCYVLAFVFMLLATYYNGNRSPVGHYFYCVYILTGVVSAFNIASRLIEAKMVKVYPLLTSSVFFIYAFHTNWFVGLYDIILNKALGVVGIDPINIVTFITTPFAKAAICIVVGLLIERFFPVVGKVLTGNRQIKPNLIKK
jgi:hypothetical protein